LATYIILARWTTQGLQKIGDSPSRLEAGKTAFEAAGVRFKEFYMVMGRYDMISVVEAPDDATLARATLAVASKGYLQTETLRAFTESEYKKIFAGIG
jgi:uncharacterized protein with GYD domain